MKKETVRLAALADIHYTTRSYGVLQPLFSHISDSADVLMLCGDITDTGLPEEARTLARDLIGAVNIPIIGVLGNHDYESGKIEEVKDILLDAGVALLDGSVCELHGVGFAGVKGFAGGFGKQALQPWGETAIKHFVQEAINEAMKLENSLAKLRTDQCVALLHYAPVRETIVGEHPEVYSYLGSYRLEEPLNRYRVQAIFHGHAHNGAPEGRTREDIPVYNVSMPLLKRMFPDQMPFRLVEMAVGDSGGDRSLSCITDIKNRE